MSKKFNASAGPFIMPIFNSLSLRVDTHPYGGPAPIPQPAQNLSS
jgi:hypothetical protein